MCKRRVGAVLALAGCLCLIAAGCGGGGAGAVPGNDDTADDGFYGNITPPSDGSNTFTVVPTTLVPGGTLTPLGNLNPPGHTLPTDHVYFYAWDTETPFPTVYLPTRPVYAPDAGILVFEQQSATDETQLMFKATSTFFWYVDGITPQSGLQVGSVVHAGDLIGMTLTGGTLDLGAFDFAVTLTYANPAHQSIEDLHTISPWSAFAEPLRDQLYAVLAQNVAPTTTDLDGRIDYDVAGTLSGDWFHNTLALADFNTPTAWPQTLVFVRDWYDTSRVRIAVGGTIDSVAGVYGIPSDAPDPATVTPASGLVAYPLLAVAGIQQTTQQYGLLLVQMTDPATIEVELFPGSQATTGQFDANAFTYVR